MPLKECGHSGAQLVRGTAGTVVLRRCSFDGSGSTLTFAFVACSWASWWKTDFIEPRTWPIQARCLR